MTDPNSSVAMLSARLSSLEGSLRRTRLALAATALLLVVTFAVGWRAEKTVEAERVLLTDDVGTPVIVLRGVLGTPLPSLVLETPRGTQLLTLGPVVRPVR
jgi:hypothetical protein